MSGGFNPVNLVSQAALAAATGGTSLFAQMAMQLASQIGQQVIQQMGQELGLPQSAIDLAQGAFAGSLGDYQGVSQNLQEAASSFAGAAGASPAEQGEYSREVTNSVDDLVSHMADGDDVKAARSGGRGGGQSWLMALAEALGKKLDKMADDMASMADQITDKTPSLTAKFGAKSQEFSILMNATTNAIKSVGEGLANSARKG
jgi:hypothetical protein